jgi:hypothetical protein
MKTNIVIFSIVGVLYFFYSFVADPATIEANPLYFLGADGIAISLIGGAVAYYAYFHDRFPVLNIFLLSFALFIVWLVGVMYVGSNLEGASNLMGALALIGFLTFLYYAFLGALNGIFGRYITVFNLIIIAHAIFVSHEAVSPVAWTNLLSIIGTHDPMMQWGIVAISTVLGISNEGYDFFVDA